MSLECVMETSNENINCLRFNIMSYRHYIMHTPTFLTDLVQHHTFVWEQSYSKNGSKRRCLVGIFHLFFFDSPVLIRSSSLASVSRSPATGGLLGAGARALGEDADAPDVGAGTLCSGAEAVLLGAFVDALAFSFGLAAAAAGIFSML